MGRKGLKPMENPRTSNGDDPAKRARELGQQIAAGILEENKTSQAKGLAQLWEAGGQFMQWGVHTFFVPFVALYAWGGMAPETWEQQGYWPVVAGFYVFRILVTIIRGNTWSNRTS